MIFFSVSLKRRYSKELRIFLNITTIEFNYYLNIYSNVVYSCDEKAEFKNLFEILYNFDTFKNIKEMKENEKYWSEVNS